MNPGKTGTAPRVRGTHQTPTIEPVVPRYSPARAGNASQTFIMGIRFKSDGTSPRVRGTLQDLMDGRAGSNRIHPRACGERCRIGFHDGTCGVSADTSPRVRGTRSSETSYCRRGRSDHPRACGERSAVTGLQKGIRPKSSPRVRGTRRLRGRGSGDSGSSPRVRGTRNLCTDREFVTDRIIPARAGNARRPHPRAAIRTGADHPRACGERRRSRHRSPRSCRHRIIPARAGNARSFLFEP